MEIDVFDLSLFQKERYLAHGHTYNGRRIGTRMPSVQW